MKHLNKLRTLFLGETPIYYAGNEDGWIRYKDIFIQVLKDDEDNYSVGWQRDVPDGVRLDEMFEVKERV